LGLRQEHGITEGVIWQQMVLFFLPIFLGSICQQVYGVADAIIVGRFVGKQALGSINSMSNLMRLFLNIFEGLATGAAIIVGQSWGARDEQRVSDAVHTGIAFSFAAGLFLIVTCIPATGFFMDLMRIPADMRPYTSVYTRIYFAGMLGSLTYNMGAGILRALGDSKRPFYFLLAASGLNILLDLLLVGVFHWGVAGAALATAIAQYATAVLVLLVLHRERHSYRLSFRRLRIRWQTLRQLVRRGIHSKIDTVIWTLMDAFGITTSTFAAQNYGAGLYDRVKKSMRHCLAFASVLIVLCSLINYCFAPELASLFISDNEVLSVAVWLVRLMAPFYLLYLFGDVFSATIRGCGETLAPMILTMFGTCVFRVLWVIVVTRNGQPPLSHMAWGYPVSWAVNSAMFCVYYFFGRWRRRLRPAQAAQAGKTAE
jgi:Na+-driven multidrug efflux pump